MSLVSGVPPAAAIADLLRQAGEPGMPQEIGLEEDDVGQTLEFAHYLRNRSAVSTLGQVPGIW